MRPFFIWLEATPLSVWIRESTSVFAFPAILSAHAIGMGLAAGINAAIALRLLGWAPGIPPPELKRFVPVMWLGFWVNTVSGILLLLGYPTKALTNPVFYLKLSLIGVAMWLFTRMARDMFGRAASAASVSASDRLLGTASLACWAGAITAGRLLAYTATRILATW
jgi:hypothetical protein